MNTLTMYKSRNVNALLLLVVTLELADRFYPVSSIQEWWWEVQHWGLWGFQESGFTSPRQNQDQTCYNKTQFNKTVTQLLYVL